MMWAIIFVLLSLFGCTSADGATETTRRPNTFAVVGGGIAGATTVLELLAQKESDIEITLFEQADEIGHARSASGIIAASMIFNAPWQYWKAADEPEDLERQRRSIEIGIDSIVDRSVPNFYATVLQYQLAKDPRTLKDNQKKFFTAANNRLEEMVDKFPKLCFALVGPWCCREGSNASAWMMTHSEAGVSCNGTVGWGHAFYDMSDWNKADKKQAAHQLHLELGKPGTAIFQNISDFFRADDELVGALFSSDLGFTRVEDIFPTFRELFEEHGVKILTNCLVTDIGKVSIDSTTSLNIHVSSSSSCYKVIGHSGAIFDRVIVASGANSKLVLKDHDERIDSQLMPVKGFAVATNSPLIPENMRTLGSQQEEFSHYVRPQRNGGVRYGFGKVMGIPDDELLVPKYDKSWEDDDVAGIKLTKLGQQVLEQKDVLKLAGVRPLSCFDNFPLLKVYPSMPGLLLNTGYGWHGFVMCWKSSQLVAEYALRGRTAAEFAFAVVNNEHCDIWTFACWPNWLLTTVLGLVCIVLIGFGAFVAHRKRQPPDRTALLSNSDAAKE